MRIFAVLFLSAVAAMAQANDVDDDIVWRDSYQSALKEARAKGKPIFLEYRCEA